MARLLPLAAFAGLLALVAARWSPLVGWDTALSGRAREFGADHPAWVGTLRIITDAGATVPFLAAGTALTVALLAIRGYASARLTAYVTALVPVVWSLAHLLLYPPARWTGSSTRTATASPAATPPTPPAWPR